MASKTEHSVSEDKAKGQKGVTQEQVGSGKDKDPTTSPKIPSEPLRLVVRVDMKVTSATKNRTAQYPFDLASGEKQPPRLRLFAPPLPGGAAIGEAGEIRPLVTPARLWESAPKPRRASLKGA